MALYKITWQGTQTFGDEWQFGCHLEAEAASLSELGNLAITWGEEIIGTTRFSSQTTLTGVMVQRYNGAGTEVEASYEDTSGETGTSIQGNLPPQVAVVLTLDTANAQRRGRMYLPAPANGLLTGQGRLTSAAAEAFAGHGGDLWDYINTAGGLMVVKQSGGGATDEVIRIRCGDIFDTQRRRRNRVGEAYASWLPV